MLLRPLLVLAVLSIVAPPCSAGQISEEAHTLAQSGSEFSSPLKPVDSLFILFSAALVFFMQAGFTLVELGTVRAKNSLNVVMKNGANFSLAVLGFFFVGFAIMFGKSSGGIMGMEFSWLSDLPHNSSIWAFLLFQTAFATIATTICSGAMAERTRYRGYLLFTIFMSTLIYPILGHWSWGSLAPGVGDGKGWLEGRHFQDFAGSTVVHTVAGACALAGIIIVGPRKGRFSKKGIPLYIPPHNVPLTALGTFILMFGWFGFNCGSLFEASNSIGRIAVNTLVAGAAGSFSAVLGFWLRDGRAEPVSMLSGILGGLVAISASCNTVTPATAVLIGAIAGLIATFGAELLLQFGVDDVVNAIPVHLFNGIWGTIALALFNEEGFSTKSLITQTSGTLATAGAAFGLGYITFTIIQRTVGLRANKEDEEHGLDFSEHASNAYPEFNSDL